MAIELVVTAVGMALEMASGGTGMVTTAWLDQAELATKFVARTS